MTIKRKHITQAGFVEVECDTADSIDTGGDMLSLTPGNAKTARFSNTNNLQAPAGKRVGFTQIELVAGAEYLPARTLESSDWTNGANIVDGDISTKSDNNDTDSTPIEVVVDFGSIATRSVEAKFNVSQKGNLNTSLFVRFTSKFYVSDTTTFGTQYGSSQVNNVQGADPAGPQNTDFTHTEAATSYRYLKFTMEQGAQDVPTNNRVGNCSVYSVNTALNASSNATVNLRSSAALDTANGTVIRSNISIADSSTVTIDDDLLLLEGSEYLTLDYTTQGGNPFDITMQNITSITES